MEGQGQILGLRVSPPSARMSRAAWAARSHMTFTWWTDAELKQLPVNGSNTGKKRRAEANRNKLQGQIATNLLGTGN